MRTKLSSWLRGKLDRYRRRRRSRAISDNAELPWLPDRRPRPLTPTAAAPGSGSGSGSSSSSGILQQHAQDGSLVFSKLPFDVRRLILELAFGKTVLHMDLSFGHPVAALERGTATPRSHCGLNVTSPKQHPTDLRLDRGLPERWQWWSSRCHCILPADKWHSSVGKPWEDHCHTGTGHYCDDWPGERPSKCQIGIMGWLLACRQA
jgi:hypothetical protein